MGQPVSPNPTPSFLPIILHFLTGEANGHLPWKVPYGVQEELCAILGYTATCTHESFQASMVQQKVCDSQQPCVQDDSSEAHPSTAHLA